jgi:ubiquinone/menaquinone biosynthesis C-methylase UbiE
MSVMSRGRQGRAQRPPEGFVAANRRVAARVERLLPQARVNPSVLYSELVRARMARLGPGAVVLDVGGGRRCAFAGVVPAGVRLVAVDSSERELALNADVCEKVVADVCDRVPFPDASVDLVVSKHVMEHLPDTVSFVRESARVLKPGGWCVHFFPCRWAVFAVVNRLLPAGLARRVLAAVVPESAERERFRPVYDRCRAGAIRRVLEQAGFEGVRVRPGFYGSHYLGFFLPVYLAGACWELAATSLGALDLCAYLVVEARRVDRRVRGARIEPRIWTGSPSAT